MEDTNLKCWNKFNVLDGFVESLKLISVKNWRRYNEEFVGFLIIRRKDIFYVFPTNVFSTDYGFLDDYLPRWLMLHIAFVECKVDYIP